jgi:hypothetical protein
VRLFAPPPKLVEHRCIDRRCNKALQVKALGSEGAFSDMGQPLLCMNKKSSRFRLVLIGIKFLTANLLH